MNQSEHSYFLEEDSNMRGIDLQTLVASRLEDMADQVEQLFVQGMPEEAKLLREESLLLAEAFDQGYTFLFLQDLTETA